MTQEGIVSETAEEIDTAASEWFGERDAGFTAERRVTFERWLAESTRHRVAFLRAERAWEEVRRLRVLSAEKVSLTPPAVGEWPWTESARGALAPESGPGQRDELIGRGSARSASRHSVRPLAKRWPVWAAAACVVALALGGFLASYKWFADVRYVTPVGGMTTVPLTDRSKLWLNTDSAIRVRLNPATRHLTLERGEAYFEVAHDSSRPFVVDVGALKAVAVGTEFSVLRNGNDLRLVVAEGVVRLETPGRSPRSESVVAGFEAITSGDGSRVEIRKVADRDAALSWLTGRLTFHEVTLLEAAREFNRYNERKIVIQGAATANLPISGVYRATKLDAFVDLLAQGYPIKVERSDDSILLSASDR